MAHTLVESDPLTILLAWIKIKSSAIYAEIYIFNFEMLKIVWQMPILRT